MKALVVTPYYHPKLGGLENYARQLNIALHELQQWDIVIVTSNHEGRQTTEDTVDDLKVYRLGTLMKFSNTPINPLWPFMIRHLIKREQPDVIIAHTPVPTMCDAAALAAGKTPFVVVYHASTLLKSGSPLFNLVARVYTIYERLTFLKATRIIAVAEYVKQQFPPKIAAKTFVLPNSIWEKQIITRSQPVQQNFVFISSLDRSHSWKGLGLIIEAMAQYKSQYGENFTLTVIGDGNYRAHYEAAAKTAGVEKQIKFVGAKFGAEKDEILRASIALICYPTTSNDAFPTVFLEAWANAVPVIAAAIGPIPSLINDGQDGHLVEAHNPEALAQTLHRVATSSPEERKRIAETAAIRTRAAYTWERQATTLKKLLGQIL